MSSSNIFLLYKEKKKAEPDSVDGPTWMKTILGLAQTWTRTLGGDLPQMRRSAENIKDPLFRCFAREVMLGATILADVKRDLADLIAICKGAKKQTNYHRVNTFLIQGNDRTAPTLLQNLIFFQFLQLLVSDLLRGIIPTSW